MVVLVLSGTGSIDTLQKTWEKRQHCDVRQLHLGISNGKAQPPMVEGFVEWHSVYSFNKLGAKKKKKLYRIQSKNMELT